MRTVASLDATTLRIDRWLWHARIYKTRSLAAEMVSRGRVRLNGRRLTKPGHAIRAGDVLTIPRDNGVSIFRVVALGTRRGPAAEGAALYTDLDAAGSVLERPGKLG